MKSSGFVFLRTWPREVFNLREGKKLTVKSVEMLDHCGVYILYCGENPWYVGKADSLFSRLHSHANKMTDRYYPHWDNFSAFIFSERSKKISKKVSEIEGILISAVPLMRNSSGPRFKKLRLPPELRKALKKLQNANVSPKAMAVGAGKI
jgi:hypothetical protein